MSDLTSRTLMEGYEIQTRQRDRIRELEAQLERCRAANVYDANAHRRVSELESALRKYGDHAVACASRSGHFKGPQYGCDCGWTTALLGGFSAETSYDDRFCPRPFNGRPEGFTKLECRAAGECGCQAKTKGEQGGN